MCVTLRVCLRERYLSWDLTCVFDQQAAESLCVKMCSCILIQSFAESAAVLLRILLFNRDNAGPTSSTKFAADQKRITSLCVYTCVCVCACVWLSSRHCDCVRVRVGNNYCDLTRVSISFSWIMSVCVGVLYFSCQPKVELCRLRHPPVPRWVNERHPRSVIYCAWSVRVWFMFLFFCLMPVVFSLLDGFLAKFFLFLVPDFVRYRQFSRIFIPKSVNRTVI